MVALGAIAGVLLLAGCSTTSAPSAASASTGRAATVYTPNAGVTDETRVLPAGVDQVHALAVTRDGQVFAATNVGLFAVSPTAARRIGTDVSDLTSLAVDSTGVFYSSGHAATSVGRGPAVGLLQSRDGGLTWQSVKGADADDFHALTARGNTIIGESAGQLWVSIDSGQKWQRTGRSAAGSLTLDSRDLWITGTDGLERAHVDGTGAEIVQDAPRLRLGSLAADKSVWGVDTSGTVWTRDQHQHWHDVGTLSPEVTAVGITGIDGRHAAIASNAGITWVSITDPATLPTMTFA
ncbi:MAG: hypothetical protein GC157_17760 [Frankiales bacterium]|nr:hypothetical protein [Frankiales bacterium]